MYDIIINYGADIYNTTREALLQSGLAELIRPDMKILLKPNLVKASPASDGATTHPDVVRALIVYLREAGAGNITIAESSWTGGNTKQAYKVCGYTELSHKFGVPLFDLKDDRVIQTEVDGYRMGICETALNTDFLINIPVLKAHCQTNITCCLKNLKGVIPDNEKRRYHMDGLHKPIALLNKAVKTHFCLVDGICGDLSFEEGGSPIERNMILLGADPLVIDSYAANLIGYDISEVPYLTYAYDMGIGKLYGADTSVYEMNADKKPKTKPARSGLVNNLKNYTIEKNACSACFAALICALHKMGRYNNEKIHIGQGYRGEVRTGVGVGDCCKGFSRSCGGCPPKASEIARFLRG